MRKPRIPKKVNNFYLVWKLKAREIEDGRTRTFMAHPGMLHAWVRLREVWNRPIYVLSGYRTPERNAEVGGHPDSGHMKGKCLDVDPCYSPRKDFLVCARKAGFTKVRFYQKSGHYHLGV